MSILTIILFFVYLWGFGFAATGLLKDKSNGTTRYLEKNLMRVGIGLAILPLLGIIISFLHLPLNWWLFLILSMMYPAYYLIRNFKNIKFRFKIGKSDVYIFIVFLLFLGTLYMYSKGAFAYPYLEDDDPWSHAIGIKYVSIEKTVFMPKEVASRLQYINPYPPSYDLLLGILHQTSPSLIWTMKFFNALIISLSIIFFYFFVKEFVGSKKKALFSTFALAMIPCFLSHFIWAIALTIPLYFVAFYCIGKIENNRKWVFISSLVIASILTISPTHLTYFALLFILYFVTKMILAKRFLKYLFFSGFLGLLISFLFWWGPMIYQYGVHDLLQGIGVGEESVFGISGTGDRLYTLGDFIFAKSQNMVNNPIGIGVVLSILVVISLFVLIFKYGSLIKKENHWKIIALVWFVFTLYAVNASRFPIKLSAFRTWMLLAIPLCILISEGFFFLLSLLGNNMAKIILIILIIGGVWFTSGYQKYQLNTTPGWPPGAFWTSMDELQGYLWLKNLPVDTKVFAFVNDGIIIGLDKFTCVWCEDVALFKETAINKSAEELHGWLKRESYQYTTIGGQEVNEFGAEIINAKINEMISSNLFRLEYQTNGLIILKVV